MPLKYFTVSELAELTGRSVQRIHQLIAVGAIAALWQGKQRVIREDVALDFRRRCAELDGHENLPFPGLFPEDEAA